MSTKKTLVFKRSEAKGSQKYLDNLNDIKRKILYTLSQEKNVPFEDLVLQVDPSLLANYEFKPGHFISNPTHIQQILERMENLQLVDVESSGTASLQQNSNTLMEGNLGSTESSLVNPNGEALEMRGEIFQPSKRRLHNPETVVCPLAKRIRKQQIVDDNFVAVQRERARITLELSSANLRRQHLELEMCRPSV